VPFRSAESELTFRFCGVWTGYLPPNVAGMLQGWCEMSWPGHPQIQDDELLSSWIVRVGRANGLGAQAFWETINQDRNSRLASVDLRASESLLRVLADATGTSLKRIRAAMLLSKTDSTQVLRRQRHRPDLRYCSVCFSEDKEPYFRRSWQSSCVLLCDRHSAWLSANCHSCAVTVRLIMISIEQSHLAICANCGQFLSTRMDPRPESPERQQLITMQKRLVSTFSKTHSSLG